LNDNYSKVSRIIKKNTSQTYRINLRINTRRKSYRMYQPQNIR